MKCLVRALFFVVMAAAVSATGAEPLFGDRIVAKGKGIEIKASQVEEGYISFKANKTAAGERVPESAEATKKIEEEILSHLIGTKLVLLRAMPVDRSNAVMVAEKFIEEKRSRAISDAAFTRQLRAVGLNPEQFREQIVEQATVKAVVDRELKSKQTVTEEQIEKFYKENPRFFQEPEKWKVQHVHLSFRDRLTLKEYSADKLAEKKKQMEELLQRAKAGEDFSKIVKENTEDTLTRDEGGFYTITRGQMPPEFEAATTSLKPGQISDIVTTRFGWHIIKLIENIPSKTLDLASSKGKIRDALLQETTQKALPDWIKTLREEAGVQIFEAK